MYYHIREVKLEDAESLLEMLNQLDAENEYMLLEVGERNQNLELLKRDIEEFRGNNSLWLGAYQGKKCFGFFMAERGKYRRIHNLAYISVGILKEAQHKKIGTEFFSKLDIWAQKERIKRLELTVMQDNVNAIALYKKSGFQVEGIRKSSILFDNKFVDEYYMAKIFQ